MRFSARWLPRLAWLTVLLLYLTVVAGAVVRATGSGMGCPDWPKCFGRFIPPTDVSQIPPELMERFLTEGHGNLLHTWVEFINRLIGALSGAATLGTLVVSIMARERPLVPLLLASGLAVFGVVAWLGKVVVDTSLAPHKVTIHMLGGVVLLGAAITALSLIRRSAAVPVSRSGQVHVYAGLALVLAQIILGTQVREAVDTLAPGQCCDGRLEQHLGVPLAWHRAGGLVTLTVVALLFFRLKFSAADMAAPLLTTMMGLVIASEYGAGVLLVKAGLPAWLQPVHLLLALVLFGFLLALALRVRRHESPPQV